MLKTEIILGEIVIIIEGCNKDLQTKKPPKIDSIEDIYNYFKFKYNISKNQIKRILIQRNK